MVWVWILMLLIVVMFVVLFSKVTAQIVYSRKEEDDNFYVRIKALFGVIRFRYAIPNINFQGFKKGLSIEREETTNIPMLDKKDHITVDRKDVVSRYEQLKVLIGHVLGFNRWLMTTLKRTHCSQISWATDIGLDDAAETAITTGMIWGLKTSILGILFNQIRLEAQPQLAVVPHFNHTQFSTDFECNVNIRLGYALLAGMYLLIRIYKVKGGIKTWRNILTKA